MTNFDEIKDIVQHIKSLSDADRMRLVEELRQVICVNCGADKPTDNCWCAYGSDFAYEAD